ncbi:hypothetical protein [Hyphomicrobium sp.]|jgi:hypothetical protein|uniref:hypothetical protein n=1 Tax=Hyphomicrobium sp. TaxID=82 RepID=UPI0035680117
MAEQSKFILTFDKSANEVNRRPNLRGLFKLAGEEVSRSIALWGGTSKSGMLYARGQVSPEGISDAIRAGKNQGADVPAPPNVELKVGEAVLFENDKASTENRQPKFFGYAREADRYVRLAGWERGNIITGSAEPYRPSSTNDDLALPSPEFE